MNDLNIYLQATPSIDCDHPAVQAWALKVAADCTTPREQAIALYKAVRDDIRYDPYTFRMEPSHLCASAALAAQRSYCIPKAILLAAGARVLGIPSRLGFANVRNHLTTQQLLDWLRSDLFVMHGYTELWLEGRWVKATPAFDRLLCRYFNVPPLEFDGIHDSVFHAYTRDGDHHMEYVFDHGHFADMPYAYLEEQVRQHYPHLMAELPHGDFEQEALAATAGETPAS